MPDLHLPLLDRVKVASPCDARWEDMAGDDKVRRCEQCSLNVHNLSAMTAAEANGLLAKHFAPDGTPTNGRFCGMIYRRADGTILTQDCPVGLARVRAAFRRSVAAVAALVALSVSSVMALAFHRRAERAVNDSTMMLGKVIATPMPRTLRHQQPFRWIVETLAPQRAAVTPPPMPGALSIRGDICVTPPSAPTK